MVDEVRPSLFWSVFATTDLCWSEFVEIDDFLKEAVPLAVNFDESRGDTLAIIRKTFPERSSDSISPEQRTALKDYRIKILDAFQTGDYVSGLEWAAKGLRVAVKRSDKIFILIFF